MSKKKPIIVDGANIAHIDTTDEGKAKVSNIILVKKALEKLDYEPIIIVDASLIYDIDDPKQLDSLIRDDQVQQAPAETDADYFVLKYAEREHAQVVTNDQYDEYRDRFSWIEKARVPVMIVDNEVVLHHPSLKTE